MAAGSETLTIVFTDLVDSTAIRSRLGEDRADDLQVVHLDTLTATTEEYNGRVVKGLGDGVLAVFDSAADAVDAAVEMQRRTTHYSARPDAIGRLLIRIGISTGDITWDDQGDIAGTAANEAARIEGMADGGQILCADLTKLVARGRGDHVFTALGEFELKGIPHPVGISEVAWQPIADAGVTALPDALAAAPDRLVGRTEEIERTHAALATGERRMVILAGEPGIGKTTIAAAVSRRAFDDGRVVLLGRCDREFAVPYRPFIDAIDHWVRSIHELDRPERLRDHAILGRISDEAARVVPPPASTESRQRDQLALFEGVTRWLSETRAVLVIDDIQWASDATILLVRHLLSTGVGGFSLIATLRPNEMPDLLRDGLAEATSGGAALHIEVVGLDGDAVRELGIEGDVDTLLQRTGGNPLFLDALGAGSDVTSVEVAVSRRVQAIDAAATEILRLAAVIGIEIDMQLLERSLELDGGDVLNALELATKHGLVRELGPGKFEFGHGLVQEAFAAQLTHTRRQVLHHRVATTLESMSPGRITELARHFDLGGDVERTIHYTRLAAERAMELIDHRSATHHYDRLAELETDPDERLWAELYALSAEIMAGRYKRERLIRAGEFAREAANRGLMEVVVRTAQQVPGFATASGDHDPIVKEVASLIDLDAIDDPQLRARASLALMLEIATNSGDIETGKQVVADLAPTVEESDDPWIEAQYLTGVAWTSSGPDDVAMGLAAARRAQLLFTQENATPMEGSSPAFMIAVHSLRAGDLKGALEGCEGMERWLHGSEFAIFSHAARSVRVAVQIARGEFENAEASILLNESQVAEQDLDIDADGIYALQQFAIRREQGRLDEIARPLQLVSKLDPERTQVWRPGFAAMLAEADMVEEAQAEIDFLLADPTERLPLPHDGRHLIALSFCADAAAVCRDPAAAAAVAGLFEPWRDHHISSVGALYLGPVSRQLGRLQRLMGEPAHSEALLRRAIEQCREAPTDVFEARAHLDLAELLVEQGRPAEARAAAERAAERAGPLGMNGVHRAAVTLATSVIG